MLGIHRDLNWKEFLKSRESFLFIVSVCTLTDLNPWFDRPWKKLWMFFCKWHFHNASKEVVCPKKVLNFMPGVKSAILAGWKNCNNGTFEPAHEIQNFLWPDDFFGTIMKVPFTKNIHSFFQGPPNPGFRSVKVQTETFPKKDLQDFKNSFYLGFLWIPKGQLISKCLLGVIISTKNPTKYL